MCDLSVPSLMGVDARDQKIEGELAFTPFGSGYVLREKLESVERNMRQVQFPWGKAHLSVDLISTAQKFEFIVSKKTDTALPPVITELDLVVNASDSIGEVARKLMNALSCSSDVKITLVYKNSVIYQCHQISGGDVAFADLRLKPETPILALVEEPQFSNRSLLMLFNGLLDSLRPEVFAKVPPRFTADSSEEKGDKRPALFGERKSQTVGADIPDSHVIRQFAKVFSCLKADSLQDMFAEQSCMAAIREHLMNIPQVQTVLAMLGVAVFIMIRPECFVSEESRNNICSQVGRLIFKTLTKDANSNVLALYYAFFLFEEELINYHEAVESGDEYLAVRAEFIRSASVGFMECNLSELMIHLSQLFDLAKSLPLEALCKEGNVNCLDEIEFPKSCKLYSLSQFLHKLVNSFNLFLFSDTFVQFSKATELLQLIASSHEDMKDHLQVPLKSEKCAKASLKKSSFGSKILEDDEPRIERSGNAAAVFDFSSESVQSKSWKPVTDKVSVKELSAASSGFECADGFKKLEKPYDLDKFGQSDGESKRVSDSEQEEDDDSEGDSSPAAMFLKPKLESSSAASITPKKSLSFSFDVEKSRESKAQVVVESLSEEISIPGHPDLGPHGPEGILKADIRSRQKGRPKGLALKK
eukprot:TRINITY_DN5980_c0_g1_i1.p1 TRINITY_DN5980_c0_g1~~TRINITY_DN5980_c0_g1_i1.p1  ORF type:complete len:645 (-),score=200.76 TRINITY_DN5980_c0_g1_i1:1305-3239(-)